MISGFDGMRCELETDACGNREEPCDPDGTAQILNVFYVPLLSIFLLFYLDFNNNFQNFRLISLIIG